MPDTDVLVTYGAGCVMSVERLARWAFGPTRTSDVTAALSVLAEDDPPAAVTVRNTLLARMVRRSRWTDNELRACQTFLSCYKLPHDDETVALLSALCVGHPRKITEGAAYALLNLGLAPPTRDAMMSAIERYYAEPGRGRHPSPVGLSVTTGGYRSMQGRVAREWERACEALAGLIHGDLLLARRGETVLSNGLRPDFIPARGPVKRDDAGTICWAETVIDAKSGAVGPLRYDGYCRHLDYWCRVRSWPGRRESRGTRVSVYLVGTLVEMALEVGGEAEAVELARLGGAQGDVLWRYMEGLD